MALQAGEKISNFKFRSAYEDGVDFQEKLQQADYTYLIFLRYYGCTSCQIDIMELAEAYPEFQKKNAQIFVVLQSKPEIVSKGVEEHSIPFDFICDEEKELYQLFDVKSGNNKAGLVGGPVTLAKLMSKMGKGKKMGLSHGEYEGDEYQLPGYFLLDKEGTVKKAHYAKDIMDMPEPKEYLAMI